MTESSRDRLLDFECFLCRTRFPRSLTRPESEPRLLCPACSSPEKLEAHRLGMVVAAATMLDRFRECTGGL